MAFNVETHRLGPGTAGLEGDCDKFSPATFAFAFNSEVLPVRFFPLGFAERRKSGGTIKLIFHLRAFSTVIADNQFSTLGIVLFAATARLAKATGMRYPSAKSVSTRVDVKQKSKSQPQPAVVKAVVDRGERISRGDGDGGDLPIPMRKKQQSRSNDEGSEKPDKEKKKVKKSSSKKKKNAIDDLFDGLF